MRLPLRFPLRRQVVCQQAVELVTGYLEDELSPAERRRFERHLASCPHCTEYLAQMRVTIAVTGQIRPGDLSAPMRADFIELYRRWQRDDR